MSVRKYCARSATLSDFCHYDVTWLNGAAFLFLKLYTIYEKVFVRVKCSVSYISTCDDGNA